MNNINLIRKIAWGFMPQAPSTIEFSDLINEAYLAYEKAKENYNPEKSKFTTWAYYYMSGYLKNFLNEERKQTGHQELNNNLSYFSKPISETLSDLGKEARQICYVILCTPNVYGRLTKAKSKKRIKNILRAKGWSHKKIKQSFVELQTHFQEG